MRCNFAHANDREQDANQGAEELERKHTAKMFPPEFQILVW